MAARAEPERLYSVRPRGSDSENVHKEFTDACIGPTPQTLKELGQPACVVAVYDGPGIYPVCNLMS